MFLLLYQEKAFFKINLVIIKTILIFVLSLTIKQIIMSRVILGTETYKKGDNRIGLILNDNLIKLFQQVSRECLPFKEGLSDQGSCCLGMGLEVTIYESKRNKPTKYRLIKQIWQGSLGNEEYFKRSLNYIKLSYPDLYPFCSINYGRMD